jgi:hypothetical protein
MGKVGKDKSVKPILAFFLLLLSTSIVLADDVFEVVPNTVGIGLQKNFDAVDFSSSSMERCVLYHLGNPWSTNVTGWLVVSDELADYFTRNSPESVFVPSGTFRYNSSCCLLPIWACFQFPYTLEKTSFVGRVSSAFTTGGGEGAGGTGSATGSSVSYSLTINVLPLTELDLTPGETRCIDIFQIGQRCFSSPIFVPFDFSEGTMIDGHTITLNHSNNMSVVVLVVVVLLLLIVGIYIYHFNPGLLKKIRKNL